MNTLNIFRLSGKKSITASKTNGTPLFLKDEPQTAGTISFASVLSLNPALYLQQSSSSNICSCFSSLAGHTSTILLRHSSAKSTNSAGISFFCVSCDLYHSNRSLSYSSSQFALDNYLQSQLPIEWNRCMTSQLMLL